MRRGITLYEVVLALAIFSGSVAAISEGIATGTRAALQSRLQSQAILLCESKMGEIVSGALPPASAGPAPFTMEPGLDGWTWLVAVRPSPRLGLMSVEVTVVCQRAGRTIDASFTLARYVRDLTAFQTDATQAAATSSSSSSGMPQQAQH
jgi:general secretion pathway protein I